MTSRNAVLLCLFALACAVSTHGQSYYKQNAVLVPAYQATYSSSDDLLKQILTEIKGIRDDLRGLKVGMGGAAGGRTALNVVAEKCLKCHQDGKAATDGGDFVLVEKDGTLSDLSLAEKRRVVREVEKGRMPREDPLTDADKKLVIDYFSKQEQKKEQKQ